MAFYLGEVLCRHAGFSWVVQEFAFEHGRYEVGVKRSLATIMLTRGRSPKASNNKRMQSIWSEYLRYAL
jgi:hypothetical protein